MSFHHYHHHHHHQQQQHHYRCRHQLAGSFVFSFSIYICYYHRHLHHNFHHHHHHYQRLLISTIGNIRFAFFYLSFFLSLLVLPFFSCVCKFCLLHHFTLSARFSLFLASARALFFIVSLSRIRMRSLAVVWLQ